MTADPRKVQHNLVPSSLFPQWKLVAPSKEEEEIPKVNIYISTCCKFTADIPCSVLFLQCVCVCSRACMCM